jgi:predicted GNAT superfamily acetyltransferase
VSAATDLAQASRWAVATAAEPSAPAGLTAAIAAAEAAARSAGVYIRALDGVAELQRMCELYERIWRFGDDSMPISLELMRAMSKAGNYIAGAFDGAELVGACVGFFGPPAHRSLHSHIAGVSPRARGRSIGFALKLHQRAWALGHGIAEIAWTYDPLVGRNAYFNIGKLGARPVEYLANFYGPMHDGLNGADETDRLLIEWRLEHPRVVAACGGTPGRFDAAAEEAAGARYALRPSPSGDPQPAAVDSPTVLVAVPRDIEGLRASDPACAARWRGAVREVLGGLLAAGGRIRGFDRGDCYIVEVGGH